MVPGAWLTEETEGKLPQTEALGSIESHHKQDWSSSGGPSHLAGQVHRGLAIPEVAFCSETGRYSDLCSGLCCRESRAVEGHLHCVHEREV